MEQNFTAISHRIGEPQGPLHSGADPENYAPRAPSGPVVVGLSHYTNGDRGKWTYGISFRLPDGGGQNGPPMIDEDEEGWEDPNLIIPAESFLYTFGPDNTDEDDGDLGGGEGGPASIGFFGYGGFERAQHGGLDVYNRGDDTALVGSDFPGGRLVLLSSLPGAKKR